MLSLANKISSFFIMSATTDPFDILNDSSRNVVETLPIMVDTGILLRRFIIGAGVVMFIVGLIAILLIRNNERMYEETKSKIMRVLLIIWLAANAVTIFNVIKGVIDGIF